ncbi:EFh [Musa troglodytarum]|uniref:EFh n=1 Tax=Musa troglodytarum TaxID=320322 RepID=A0A9E7JUN7_9LILI|nr:EFh [Musa troglodytarum]
MSVEILDGSTVREFVEDEGAFNGSVEERFASLDMDHDGLLTYPEMARELMSLRVRETHFGVDEAGWSHDELLQLYLGLFGRFDRDGNGTVDLEEFRAEMREVMLAVASGLGFLPVQMVVEEGSFLKRAVERESAKHVFETLKKATRAHPTSSSCPQMFEKKGHANMPMDDAVDRAEKTVCTCSCVRWRNLWP